MSNSLIPRRSFLQLLGLAAVGALAPQPVAAKPEAPRALPETPKVPLLEGDSIHPPIRVTVPDAAFPCGFYTATATIDRRSAEGSRDFSEFMYHTQRCLADQLGLEITAALRRHHGEFPGSWVLPSPTITPYELTLGHYMPFKVSVLAFTWTHNKWERASEVKLIAVVTRQIADLPSARVGDMFGVPVEQELAHDQYVRHPLYREVAVCIKSPFGRAGFVKEQLGKLKQEHDDLRNASPSNLATYGAYLDYICRWYQIDVADLLEKRQLLMRHEFERASQSLLAGFPDTGGLPPHPYEDVPRFSKTLMIRDVVRFQLQSRLYLSYKAHQLKNEREAKA